MAQREVKPLSKEDKKLVQDRIVEVRKEIGFTIGDPITYDVIAKAHSWCINKFRYKSDEYSFDESDFWNTLTFEWMLLDGYLEDDCDGYGYTILSFMYHVLKVRDSNLFRVSCATETNEGHFVAWVKLDDGIYYQVENRVRQPRSIKYMRELGYTYWHYSSLSPKDIKANHWFNAEKRAAEIVYNTPPNLESDEPNVSTEELIEKIPESKTLQLGAGVGISTVIGVVTTLANSTDWKIVALVGFYGILLTGLIFYIRGKTHTSLGSKGKIFKDSEGFVA